MSRRIKNSKSYGSKKLLSGVNSYKGESAKMENEKSVEEIKAELEQLEAALSEVADNVKKARALGDLSENNAYHEAKQELDKLGSRKWLLKAILRDFDNAKEGEPKSELETEDSFDISNYITAVKFRHEFVPLDKNKPEDCVIDLNAKVIIYALQSLGFYAEIADYKARETGTYGHMEDVSVILTNANEHEFLTLWDSEYNGDDDEKIEHYYEKYSPVKGGVFDRCCVNEDGEGGWCYPSYVYEIASNTIKCGFDERRSYGNNAITIINQTPKYLSDKVLCFYSKGEYPQFSNFYLSEMEIKTYQGRNSDGTKKIIKVEEYASVEHYFQIMKALEFDPDGEALKQMGNHLTCAQIKSLGRKVGNFDARVWNIRRRFHMRDALALKFWQNPELRKMLLDTGDAVLAEASPRDTFWGIGYSKSNPKAHDPAAWRGKNVLGNMLMYLREDFRESEAGKKLITKQNRGV
jgi:ribA/ribD-fused uncharacterized protein